MIQPRDRGFPLCKTYSFFKKFTTAVMYRINKAVYHKFKITITKSKNISFKKEKLSRNFGA